MHTITAIRIREERKRCRLSQVELANRLHVHQTAISQWENGKTEPDIENLSRMAELFSVSVDYLMGLEEKTKPTVQSDGLRGRVLNRLNDLTAEELQRVDDFLSGIRSGRKG